MRITYVILKSKILVLKVKNVPYVRVEFHCRETMWFTSKKLVYLIYMVRIDMTVTARPDELTRSVVGYLSNHHSK